MEFRIKANKMKKRFFIYSEKHEKTVIRFSSKRQIFNGMCEKCGKKVEWLNLEKASLITGKRIEEIKRGIEIGEFDFRTTDDNRLLVCLNSISR